MIDKRLLVDSVQVRLVTGVNEFGKELLSEPFDLTPVRFDRKLVMRPGRTKVQNPQLEQGGVIYHYPQYSNVEVDDSWIHAKIIDGTNEYEVVGYQSNCYPFSSRVFSNEIEVI